MRHRTRQEKEREREWVGKAKRCHGNWEPSADSMFFHSFPTHHQLPSISLPVHSSFHCFSPASPSLLSFRSLYHDHTPFTFLSLSLSVTSLLSFQHLSLFTSTTPLFFFTTSPFHPSLASFLPTRSFSPFFFFSIFLSPPLFLFSQLLRLNPQLCAKSSKEETERLKSNIKKRDRKRK